jgi:anti-sigma regulatory factor (Ser/Thr protein kinase)
MPFKSASLGEDRAVSHRGQLAGGAVNHVVQFYGADDELADSVGRYLAEGLRSGDGVVVVATAPHRLGLDARLARDGLDADRERRAGRLLSADASGLLGSFLGGGRLDPGRFEAAAAGLIGRAAAGGRPVRVYAEMVALLWDAGDVALAIELEELWNSLCARLPISLVCGYPSSVLAGQGAEAPIRHVCRLHSAVADQRSFPAERNSVRAARYYVTSLLGAEADDMAACDAAIVATELAANAVLHARSGFTMTISRSAARTRIAVRDSTPLENAGLEATGPEATGPGTSGKVVPFEVMTGHGLSVVSQLASRWAVDPLPDGKVVWAELPAAGLPAPGAAVPSRQGR